MIWIINGNGAKYQTHEGAISKEDEYFVPGSYVQPVPWNESRCKIYAHLDVVSLNLVIQAGAGISTSGKIASVASDYRPGVPVFLPVRKDAAPYEEIGVVQITTNGEFKYYFKNAPSTAIIINGHYMVKSHE